MTPEKIIDFFGMKPLPDEGGYYVETYRATEKLTGSVLPQRYAKTRNISTAMEASAYIQQTIGVPSYPFNGNETLLADMEVAY